MATTENDIDTLRQQQADLWRQLWELSGDDQEKNASLQQELADLDDAIDDAEAALRTTEEAAREDDDHHRRQEEQDAASRRARERAEDEKPEPVQQHAAEPEMEIDL